MGLIDQLKENEICEHKQPQEKYFNESEDAMQQYRSLCVCERAASVCTARLVLPRRARSILHPPCHHPFLSPSSGA